CAAATGTVADEGLIVTSPVLRLTVIWAGAKVTGTARIVADTSKGPPGEGGAVYSTILPCVVFNEPLAVPPEIDHNNCGFSMFATFAVRVIACPGASVAEGGVMFSLTCAVSPPPFRAFRMSRMTLELSTR